MKAQNLSQSGRSRRCLSIVILAFLPACDRGSGGRELSQLTRISEEIGDPKLEAGGIYADGWAGETCSVVLRQPSGPQVLTIRGMIPQVGDRDFHTEIELRVDEKSVGRQILAVGDFRVSAPVAAGSGKRRIVATFSASQQLPGEDGRKVGARLQFLGFESANRTSATDIVRGPGVELGRGWGVVETFRGEMFRWVDNDAQIRLTASQAGEAAFSLVVEPGPGVGGKPFLLKALDESGRQVAAVRVEGRGTVKLFVPVEAGKPNEFRLHADGGGRPAKNDPRILNFRVLEIGLEPALRP
jgi:hypothetical protein